MSEQEVFEALRYRIEVDVFGTRKYHNSTGQLHRTDGPAVVYANAEMQWWIHGEHMSEDKFKQMVKRL